MKLKLNNTEVHVIFLALSLLYDASLSSLQDDDISGVEFAFHRSICDVSSNIMCEIKNCGELIYEK